MAITWLTHEMWRNDLLPIITATAAYANGSPVDLSGATNVKFYMRPEDSSTPKVNATAVVSDGPNGEISYSWSGTDTDTAGRFIAEFEVQLSGKRLTFPGKGQGLEVIIKPDIV